MAVKRFFYVTQDFLAVWKAARSSLKEEIRFPGSDEGFRLFSAYLEKTSQELSSMLVDVIEEEFFVDEIPKLSAGDRRGLIERRLSKRFPRTPFRLGIAQGRTGRDTDATGVLYAAITNHELVDPWVEIVTRHKTPLVGVFSVPLLGLELLREFRKPAENSLFLTQHQGERLRQVFVKAGHPLSARLSRIEPAGSAEFGRSLVSEIVQSRKYLERARYLSHSDLLDVYLIADQDTASRAFSDKNNRIDFRAHIIDAKKAAAHFKLSSAIPPGHMEALYLARCIRKKPKHKYELKDRTDYSLLLKIRNASIAVALAGAVASSIAIGILFASSLTYRDASQTIESQMMRLEETYRREHDELEPVRADSHEMKLAVDTGDFILRNSLPVEWVMAQVGNVMDDYSDMHIGQLSWEIEAPASNNDAAAQQRSRQKNAPVPIPEIASVTASLTGEIRPYDGNLRHAFSRIDQLARRFEEKTAFDRVAVTQYPIDARPGSSVSGEVRRRGNSQTAEFSIQLTLRVDDEAR
jgi:hypothetical protein